MGSGSNKCFLFVSCEENSSIYKCLLAVGASVLTHCDSSYMSSADAGRYVRRDVGLEPYFSICFLLRRSRTVTGWSVC